MHKIKIDLVTMENIRVTTAVLPPFQIMPDVLIWGSRVFQRAKPQPVGKRDTYAEAFAVAVIETTND